MNLLRTLKRIIKNYIDGLELNEYNQYTIEEYFRKKGYDVGKNNRIFIRDLGSEPYLVKIGNHVAIAAGVSFITHDGGCFVFREELPDLHVFGKIEVKDNCMIGMNSIILPDVTIGPNSVVGAGSVVAADVPPNAVVGGVPAKFICSLAEYKEKCVKRGNEFHLEGPRSTWEAQLRKHFGLYKNK